MLKRKERNQPELLPEDFKLYILLEQMTDGPGTEIPAKQITQVIPQYTDKPKVRAGIRRIRRCKRLTRVPCSNSKGYFMGRTHQESWRSAESLYLRGLDMMITAKAMKDKIILDGQTDLNLTPYEKEMLRSIATELLNDGKGDAKDEAR